jgi:hypothetical protein
VPILPLWHVLSIRRQSRREAWLDRKMPLLSRIVMRRHDAKVRAMIAQHREQRWMIWTPERPRPFDLPDVRVRYREWLRSTAPDGR